ncbi:MAG: metal ABC transporter solute-binding protein, Zn/Mn family [Thermodesulfobacteriota bacterium]
MRPKAIVFLLTLVFFSGLCSGSQAAEPVQVTVSIPPQAYFVNRLAKDLVRVSVMVPGGASPATYEPKPTQMTALARSTLYFAIGVPFEKAWLKKFARINPHMRMIHTDQGIQKRKLGHHPQKSAPEPRSHGQNSSTGCGTDPHIWLSPPLVKRIARTMTEALIQVDPDCKKQYQQNLKAFIRELDRLDQRIQKILDINSRSRSEILVFHPSWGYFLDRYGLKQVSIEIEGKSPSAMEMVKLTRHVRRLGVNRIFVQPQFSKRSAEAMARQIGAKVVIVDPLSEDWSKNLLEVATAFSRALK